MRFTVIQTEARFLSVMQVITNKAFRLENGGICSVADPLRIPGETHLFYEVDSMKLVYFEVTRFINPVQFFEQLITGTIGLKAEGNPSVICGANSAWALG
jgi:hypothetical protein